MRSRNIRDGLGIDGTAALKLIQPVSRAGQHGRRGRPPFEPTIEHRHQVEALAGYGLTRKQIASVIINPNTGRPLSYHNLEKYFRHELNIGRIKANAAVAQSLFRHAIGNGPGAVRAAIWWTRARMGWRGSGPAENEPTGARPRWVDGDGAERAKELLRELLARPATVATKREAEGDDS